MGEFGDTTNVAPTYSVAKSMLATVAGVAVRERLITNLEAPVGLLVKDGGYDARQNAKVTWKNHLQQVTEWEGEMWGKKHDFVGTVAFGDGERKPRELEEPGTFYEYNDVRINRFSLSMLRLFKKPIPDVFRDEVMNPIGASNTWQWIPYNNSYADVDGKKLAVGERRHALGRRRLDQRPGHGALRLPVAAQRQVGQQADHPAGVRERGADGRRREEQPGLRLPVVAEHERRREDAAHQLVPGAGRREQHDLRLPRSRPGHRVAVSRRRKRAVLPPGDRRDQARRLRSSESGALEVRRFWSRIWRSPNSNSCRNLRNLPRISKPPDLADSRFTLLFVFSPPRRL